MEAEAATGDAAPAASGKRGQAGRGEDEEAEEMKHLNEVLHGFRGYEADMMMEVARREANLVACPDVVRLLPGGEERMVREMAELRRAVGRNQFLFERMMSTNKVTTAGGGQPVKPSLGTEVRNLSKVRSTLHQCAREWSLEGAEERSKCFDPLLDLLEANLPPGGARRVLVPGSGLGRLVAEVVARGYSCQGNEFSWQMLFMCEFILNELTSSAHDDQAELFPWIHNPSNTKSFADLVRPVRIPDVSATELLARNKSLPGPSAEMSMCSGEFVEIYSKQPAAWDAVVTCFFIDTAPNVLDYIKVIFAALKPGGVWVNGGPLLWHWQSNGPKGGNASAAATLADKRYGSSIELTYEQVRGLVEGYGFELREERWEEVGYTGNARSMMRSTYSVAQFVAVKPL